MLGFAVGVRLLWLLPASALRDGCHTEGLSLGCVPRQAPDPTPAPILKPRMWAPAGTFQLSALFPDSGALLGDGRASDAHCDAGGECSDPEGAVCRSLGRGWESKRAVSRELSLMWTGSHLSRWASILRM
jgi:hypothetical protein